jgi:hypothetical protein
MREVNIVKAFDRHSLCDVHVYVDIDSDEQATLKERPHPFILDRGFSSLFGQEGKIYNWAN